MISVPEILTEQFSWRTSRGVWRQFSLKSLKRSERSLLAFLKEDAQGCELAPRYYLAPAAVKHAVISDPYIIRSLEILDEHHRGLFGVNRAGSMELHRAYLLWTVAGRLKQDRMHAGWMEYDHLPLDFGLQLVFGNSEHHEGGARVCYRRKDANTIAESINQALRTIGSFLPNCLAFVVDFLKVIEVHGNYSDPSVVSRHPAFSLLLVDNIHRLVDEPGEMIELLIKAAGFHYLQSLAHDSPIFSPKDEAKSLDESYTLCPWSGDSISLRSYIYACPLWFGVHNFFRLSWLKMEHTSPFLWDAYRRSMLGFLTQRRFLMRLGEELSFLEPEFQEFIHSCHHFVRNRHVEDFERPGRGQCYGLQ